MKDAAMIRRAWGCFLGQLAGDSLGSQVEYKAPERIASMYPYGMASLEGSELYRTLPGQPTDDSEMALALARNLAQKGFFHAEGIQEDYVRWLKSRPVDFAHAVFRALHGKPDVSNESNCALMRVSPLGIFGVRMIPDTAVPCADGAPLNLCSLSREDGVMALCRLAMEEAALTNPHILCQVTSAIYVSVLAFGIRSGAGPQTMYDMALALAERFGDHVEYADSAGRIGECLLQVRETRPVLFQENMSHVLLAFGNGFWELLHAPDAGSGVRDTVVQGGDAAANGAVAGALLGAAYDIDSFPEEWTDTILVCRPQSQNSNVRQPRPEDYWPLDFMSLSERLLGE